VQGNAARVRFARGKNLHPAGIFIFSIEKRKCGVVFFPLPLHQRYVYTASCLGRAHFTLPVPTQLRSLLTAAAVSCQALCRRSKNPTQKPLPVYPQPVIMRACSTRSARPVALVPRASPGRLPSCSQRLARSSSTRVKRKRASDLPRAVIGKERKESSTALGAFF
jgi:hypothetical protein